MWPVDDTGRNSVSPSIIARIIASKIDIARSGGEGQVIQCLESFQTIVLIRLTDLLFCWLVQNGNNFYNEASHNDDRAER